MGEEVDKDRAIIRFKPRADGYTEIDFSPVISALANVTTEIAGLSDKLSFIALALKNGKGITIGTKKVSAANVGKGVQIDDVQIPHNKAAVIWALDDNAGKVFYGGTKSEAASHDFPVPANQSREVKCTNLNQVWIDAENADDGVAYGVELPPEES